MSTEPVTSCLGVPVPSTESGDEGPYDAKQVPSSGNYLSEKLSDSDSDLAPDKRQYVKTRSLV